MQKTLAEIAKLIDGEVVGDKDIVIKGICGIREAEPGDLTFVAHPKYFSQVEETKASAVIIPKGVEVFGKPIIRVANPSLAFTKAVSLFRDDKNFHPRGIHPLSIIATDAVIGKNVSVGPYTVVESNARIGDNTIIYSGCFIGQETVIGRDCLFYPNLTIRERISIGDRVIIHSGTVIGSDGFGFVDVNGEKTKIPQVGTVVIEDDVEIGANVTVDRARFDKTFIGHGTKIDNLVQIAHNVIIKENCLIVSQAGISGSTRIERDATLAGQAGIAGHLTIGEGAIVAAQAGVTKSVLPRTIVSGYPAKPHAEAKRTNAHVQRLGQYVQIIYELRDKVQELENLLRDRKKKDNPPKRKWTKNKKQ
ncbi:MAG: UDP-3-O-(3-hydroxymyristoyl)glucosamine N-acyltransferase [Candidatus Omnitrophota bacterium]